MRCAHDFPSCARFQHSSVFYTLRAGSRLRILSCTPLPNPSLCVCLPFVVRLELDADTKTVRTTAPRQPPRWLAFQGRYHFVACRSEKSRSTVLLRLDGQRVQCKLRRHPRFLNLLLSKLHVDERKGLIRQAAMPSASPTSCQRCFGSAFEVESSITVGCVIFYPTISLGVISSVAEGGMIPTFDSRRWKPLLDKLAGSKGMMLANQSKTYPAVSNLVAA